MLFIYAPWCGHCKKLKPIYTELSEKIKEEKEILLTMMDGSANEVDGITITGFPTLIFYKKGDKTN